MLSKDAVEEFNQLLIKRGVTLDNAAVSLRANNLINFYQAVLGNTPSGQGQISKHDITHINHEYEDKPRRIANYS